MPRFDSNTQLSREHLEQLYIEQSLTALEIANRLGCGETTVFRALDKYGIARRSKSDYRLEIPREELERLYLVEELSESEIAERYETSQLTISRRLREFGIATRPIGSVPSYTVPKDVLATWSASLAYAVGLIATDGSLDKDRVRVEFISTDRELINLYLFALQLIDVHLVITKLPLRKAWYKVKISDSEFRRFLERIGLTPNKSKTLGALHVPNNVFVDFVRGVFDGDGSWYLSSAWNGRYHYLHAELVSASPVFIDWIAKNIQVQAKIEGTRRTRSLGRYHYLTFIGQKAIALGEWLYESSSGLSLSRKRRVWEKARNEANSRRKE